jgi:hypothetical protein
LILPSNSGKMEPMTASSPFTVYFDTYFYVDLASLDAAAMSEAIAAMNALALRPVLSRVLIEELLKDTAHLDRDRRLAEQMLLLDQPSLALEDNLSWAMLQLGLEQRLALANLYRQTELLQTLGDSLATTGRNALTPMQKQRMQARLNKLIAQTGFASVLQSGQAQVENLFGVLSPVLKVAGVDLGDTISELRDLRRLADFLRHADVIDLFQMGKAQFERMAASGPSHPLIANGLSGRCFWSEGHHPGETIESVRAHQARSPD